jgi:hypothetical protein
VLSVWYEAAVREAERKLLLAGMPVPRACLSRDAAEPGPHHALVVTLRLFMIPKDL